MVLLLLEVFSVVVTVPGLLLLLGTISDDVSRVTALEAGSSITSSSLLPVVVELPELPCEQGQLLVRNALHLFNGSCNKRRQSKLQRRLVK